MFVLWSVFGAWTAGRATVSTLWTKNRACGHLSPHLFHHRYVIHVTMYISIL